VWGEKGSPVNCGFFFCDITSAMTFDQVATVKIYNFLCVIVFAVVFGYILLLNVWESFFSFFVERDAEATVGETSTKEFYEISGANAYVPHIELPMQEPVLFVDFSNQVNEGGAIGCNAKLASCTLGPQLSTHCISCIRSILHPYFCLLFPGLQKSRCQTANLSRPQTFTNNSTIYIPNTEAIARNRNPNRFECF